MELNNTKKEIINHLIACHEGRTWGSKLSKYFRAFTGDFSPDMPFTFYFVSETRPVMYVYDPRPGDKRSSRAIFHAECYRKKPKILEIAGFFEYLVADEYLYTEYKGLHGRARLPDNHDTVWRKYSDFYNNIMNGLSYICLSDFIPTQKLYDIRQSTVKNDKVLELV